MGPVNPIVKLTKYKKVTSMADISQLEDLPEERCSCGSVACLEPDEECYFTKDIDDTCVLDNTSFYVSVAEHKLADDSSSRNSAVAMDTNCAKIDVKSELAEEEDLSSLENFDGDVQSSSGPQQFRSGTLTRKSRRTSREQRSKEHMAQCADVKSAPVASGDKSDVVTIENTTETVPTLTMCVELKPDKSRNDVLIDSMDGKVSDKTTNNRQMCAYKYDTVQGRAFEATVKDFGGIGPRGGVRRHSVHSGYLTLPRMGFTLSDLKTQRKGEKSPPVSPGSGPILDLKNFNLEQSQNNVVKNTPPSRCVCSLASPLPNRPSTISYSFRFKNNVGRKRKSITSIENLFKSIRNLSAPTTIVLEEKDEASDKNIARVSVRNPAKMLKKQLSSSSMRSPNSGSSSTSSSCHSSPVPTPQLVRKSVVCHSVTSSATGSAESSLPLDLEEIIHVSEEFLCLSPSTTLTILKVREQQNHVDSCQFITNEVLQKNEKLNPF